LNLKPKERVMSATSAPHALVAPAAARPATARRVAVAACLLGAVTALAEAWLNTVPSLTASGHYRHAADYWLSATAVPIAAAAVLLMLAVRGLQGGQAGRAGRVGVVLALTAQAYLAATCAASVVVGRDIQAGYPLATLVTLVGLVLFVVGSWRRGVLPRRLLAAWPIAWAVGSFFALGPSPVLLAAWYVTALVVLRRGEPSAG
jgi:hypothetical protein